MAVFTISGAVALFGGVLKFADHGITAYFMVLAILFLDAGASSIFGAGGVIGGFFGEIIFQLSGVRIIVLTWYLLFLYAVFPFVVFALKKSG